MALEAQWLENIAMLTGHQYAQWNDALRGLVHQHTPLWRVKDVRNMIRPHSERRIAYLTAFTPKFNVRPNSREIGDEQAARVGGKIVPSYYSSCAMPEKIHELAYWIVSAGNGFLRVGFDQSAGDSFVGPEFDENGKPILDAQGLPLPRVYYTGDIYTDLVSPFSVHIDPLVQRPSDLERVVIRTARSIEWVRLRFGDEAAEGIASLDTEDIQSERAVLSLIGPGTYGAVASTPQFRQRWCVFTELWERRSAGAPEGRLILQAGKKILRHSKSPMPDAELPIVWFRDMMVPGRPWGQSFIDNLVLPQKNYNRLVSSVLEHIYVTCHAKLLEPSLAGTEESDFVTEHGERIKYYGNQAPSYLAPPPLPGDLDKAMAQILHDMDMTALSFGASRGQSQGRASGAAINMLIEQDLQSKEPQIARMAYGLEQWARLVLKLAQQNVKSPRVVKIYGADGALDVDSFIGADLRGNYDVSIDVGQMMPKSRALSMQMMQALGQVGLFNPGNPRHVAAGFKMLELESPDPIIEDVSGDRHGAQIEDKWMLAGIPPPPPQYFEDHDMHVAQHTMTMKSDAWKMAPPQVQQLFHMHVAGHYKLAYPQAGVTLTPEQQRAGARQPSGDGGNDDGEE